MQSKQPKKKVFTPNKAALDANAHYISISKSQWWLGHKWSIRTHGSAKEWRFSFIFLVAAIDAIRLMGSADLLALIVQMEFPSSVTRARREAARLRKRYDASAFKTQPLGSDTDE